MIADDHNSTLRPQTDTFGNVTGPSVTQTRREQRMSRMAAIAAALASTGSLVPGNLNALTQPPAKHQWKPKGRNQRIKRK